MALVKTAVVRPFTVWIAWTGVRLYMPKAVEKPAVQMGAGSTYGRNAAPKAFSLRGLQIAIGAPLTKTRFAATSRQRPHKGLSFCTSKHPTYRAGRQ